MRIFYSFAIFLYGVALRVAALFNAKARLWVNGRKDWQNQLHQKIANNSAPVIWFHCASLGEFEQGRPIIEQLKKDHPEYFILLTFFSPSGYEVRKNYPGADYIAYLPLDTKTNVRAFLRLAKPSLVVFVKYEFWLNYLSELRENQIPHLLVAAIFRPNQIFFKPWGTIFRDALKGYAKVFVQEEESQRLLHAIGIESKIAGDPRFDRVIEISKQSKEIPIVEAFSESKSSLLVAGSTWPDDEERLLPLLAPYLQNEWKLLIAPHELGENHFKSIEQRLIQFGISANHIVRYSSTSTAEAVNARVLIIDNMGMLSSLYRYGQLAYIGGGFGKSIHNTLEAAVYGIPVVFGPAHTKFHEAQGLLKCGGAYAATDTADLRRKLIILINDDDKRKHAGQKAGDFVQANKGATAMLAAAIHQIIITKNVS